MQNNKLFEILREIGLTENEAGVYLASLALGPATILKISRATEIKRPTVYLVVESLKKKGLMSIETRGLKNLYVAENPEKLEMVLEQRKNLFRKNLPDFSAIYNTQGDEPIIKTYSGIEAVKTVYEGLLNDIQSGQDYLVVSDQHKWMNLDKKYFTDLFERRAKLPIKIRMLLQDSEEARWSKTYERNFNAKVKIFPKETKLDTNLIVTPQKIVVHQLVEPIMAIVIENKSAIKMHQEIFEVMWNSIKE